MTREQPGAQELADLRYSWWVFIVHRFPKAQAQREKQLRYWLQNANAAREPHEHSREKNNLPEGTTALRCQAGGRKVQSTGPPFLGATVRGAGALGHHHAGSPKRKQLLAHSIAGHSSTLHGQAEIPRPAFQGSQGKPTARALQAARPGLQGPGCSWRIILPRSVTSTACWGHRSPCLLPCTQRSEEPSQTTPLQKTQTSHMGHRPPWAARALQDMAPALRG